MAEDVPYEHLSRFGRFIEDRGLKPTAVAEAAGYSRQHVLRLRKKGYVKRATPRMVEQMVRTVRALVRDKVSAEDLFILDDRDRERLPADILTQG